MPDYTLSPSMLYGEPVSILDGDLNYVSYTATGASQFTSGETVRIQLNSNSEFLDCGKSYLSFDLKLTGGASSAGNILTSLGASSVIQRFTSRLSGKQTDDITNYNAYSSVVKKRLNTTNQNFLKQTELYQNQDALSATTTQYANGYRVCLPLEGGVLQSSHVLPLLSLNGGISLEFEVATPSKVICSSAGGSTGFVISNVKYVGAMITPNEAYLSKYMHSISNGREAKIPITLTRCFPITPNTNLTESDYVIPVGFIKSLRSITTVMKPTSSMTTTSDEFANEGLLGLAEYQYRIGSFTYPRNKRVLCRNVPANGTVSSEGLMMASLGAGHSYTGMNAVNLTQEVGSFIHYDFTSNPSFGSGVVVSDGTITWSTKWDTVPPSAVAHIFIEYDAVVHISSEAVNVVSSDF